MGRTRSAWHWRGVDEVLWDLRYALRMFRRHPGFAATAVAMLALGIGVNATVFTLTNAVLFEGFPSVADNDRIVYIASRRSACCLSYPDFEDWRAQATSFEGMAVVHGLRVSLSDESGFPESYDATEVSADTFRLIGQRSILGRDFTASDETPGAAPVAILSYGFWERRYAKDPAILGRLIRIDSTPTTVIGIMGPGVAFPQKQDLWIPLVPAPEVRRRESRNLWFAFGRLAPGVSLESARAEMEGIGRRLAGAYPRTNQDYAPEVRSFNQFFIGPNENLIYASMWGAVGFVLLIACANLANLTLARSMDRSREIGVRMALGAGRWRIVRQLLLESTALSVLGGFLGWWIARWAVGLYALAERGPGLLPWRVLDYSMDYRTFAYVAVISIATGLLFGLAPGGGLSRLQANAILKDGDRGTTGGRRGKRLSAVLVTGEMALAVVLLAGAGVMIRSYLNVATTGAGVTAEGVLTARVELPDARYPGEDTRMSFYESLTARLQAVPGVESVALASTLPTWGARRVPYEPAGVPPVDEARRPTVAAVVVGPAYFETLGAAVLSGRAFQDADGVSGAPAAIVNQEFASRHWPGEDVLGRRLRLFDGATPSPWLTVVGVVSNIVQNDATRQEVEALVYLPYRQEPAGGMWVLARTRASEGGLGAAFRRELQALDADLPVWLGPFALTERMAEVYWDRELYGVLFLILAGMALLLASVGLYGVVAHSVTQRTREIGVRIAVGATARDILGLVYRQGMLPLAVGLTIGLAASLAVTRVLESMLVGVSPADPIAYAVASVVLIMSAGLGCMIPARRAMGVDPVVALRHE